MIGARKALGFVVTGAVCALVECAAGGFKQRIAELGFIQSMNRPGKVTDNAFIESFFHSM